MRRCNSHCGLATHYVPSARLPDLKNALYRLSEKHKHAKIPYAEVAHTIDQFSVSDSELPPFSLSDADLSDIERFFSLPSFDDILEALRKAVVDEQNQVSFH